jgi:hypothetical protein
VSELEAVSAGEYTRRVESYLCRKNDGHLIRIVGPAFEKVCGWAEQGIPLKVTYRGIDRYFERYYARGPRRRPVRIEFCEADVLDVFDEWRRAVGGAAVGFGSGEAAREPDAGSLSRRGRSLTAHLERALTRLSSSLAATHHPPGFREALEAVAAELESWRARARGLRGEARSEALARLAEMDRTLVTLAVASLSDEVVASLTREARAELAGYEARMNASTYAETLDGCVRRLAREHLALPTLAFE